MPTTIAMHESGHAVLAHQFGISVGGVSIDTEQGRGATLLCDADMVDCLSISSAETAMSVCCGGERGDADEAHGWQYAAMLLGGPYCGGEDILSFPPQHLRRGDYRRAARIAARLMGCDVLWHRQTWAQLWEIGQYTIRMCEAHRGAIERLAREIDKQRFLLGRSIVELLDVGE